MQQVKAASYLAEACEFCLSYARPKRVWRRLSDDGDQGWCTGCGASRSTRQAVPLKEPPSGALRGTLPDFGPTLAAEYLQLKEWSWITRPCAVGVAQGSRGCGTAASGIEWRERTTVLWAMGNWTVASRLVEGRGHGAC